MPTKEEAEEYKRRVEQILRALADWNTDNPEKDILISKYIDKWKAAAEALNGLGIPLDDEDEPRDAL